MFGTDILTLDQIMPTPREVMRCGEVKSEDEGGLGWAGLGTHVEDKNGC